MISQCSVVLCLFLVAASVAYPNELPIVENGSRVGTVRYGASQSGAPDQAAYILQVQESVLAARRSLAAMDWPLAKQPRGFVIEVADLGPDRLGLTTIDGRVRVTTRERLADPDEDFRPRLKATVAHEYFHLCQYACWSQLAGAQEPQYLWWMEACAIYFEHRVAPCDAKTGRKLLTYEDAVPDARGAHGRDGLESASGGSNLGYCYAPLAFLLARGYGPSFLSRTWLRLASMPPGATAVRAIEATLAEDGAGPERSHFAHVYREYVLFLMSPQSRFVRDELGLDVLQVESLAESRTDLELALPGWSFRVFRAPAADTLGARVSGPDSLRAYLVGVDGDDETIQRLDGTELQISRGGPAKTSPGWLVVVNAAPGDQRAHITLKMSTSLAAN